MSLGEWFIPTFRRRAVTSWSRSSNLRRLVLMDPEHYGCNIFRKVENSSPDATVSVSEAPKSRRNLSESRNKVPCNLSRDKVPCNLSRDKVPCKLSRDKVPCNRSRDKVPCNLSRDKVLCNLSRDKVPCNLSRDRVPCNLSCDNVPCNLSRDTGCPN